MWKRWLSTGPENIVLHEINGNHMEQFEKIKDYANQVITTNSESMTIISVDPVPSNDSVVTYKPIFHHIPLYGKGIGQRM